MHIKHIVDKNINLINELVNLWYRSEKGSHTFLSEEEINKTLDTIFNELNRYQEIVA